MNHSVNRTSSSGAVCEWVLADVWLTLHRPLAAYDRQRVAKLLSSLLLPSTDTIANALHSCSNNTDYVGTAICPAVMPWTCMLRVGRRSRRTFSTDFDIFGRRLDGIVIFFNSDFKFVDDASEFSVSSLHVVFIFSSKFMLISLQSVFYRDQGYS